MICWFGGPAAPALAAFIVYAYREVDAVKSWHPRLEIILGFITLVYLICAAKKNELEFPGKLAYVTGWISSWFFFLIPLSLIVIMMAANLEQKTWAKVVLAIVLVLYCIFINLFAILLSAKRRNKAQRLAI